MEETQNKKSTWFRGSVRKPSSQQNEDPQESSVRRTGRKPGGWKTMPYILGNESCERLASFGLLSNFMVYLRRVFHMNQVASISLINTWSSVNSFTPLIGAIVSDAYLGRYNTIAIASIASFLGMIGMTLTAWLPQLHPPACSAELQATRQCKGATSAQLGFLIGSLCFLSVGTAGIRPCSVPFGADQFDTSTDKGRKGLSSFYNWYYISFTVILILSSTVVVYIQDAVSWVLGYGLPTILMFCAIVLFFMGTRVYVYVKPEGSIFASIAQVVVATYKKRKLKLPSHDAVEMTTLYDPPLSSQTPAHFKLPQTNQLRILNKSAIVQDNELKPDGTPVNKWRLCSVQQVEELKCLIKVMPIWASSILCMTTIVQQATFSVSQALQMDRRMGPNFDFPAASIGVVSYITIAIFVPIYDRLIVPALRKKTKRSSGLTELQRIGMGYVFAILGMIVAAIVERVRRDSALNLHSNKPGAVEAPMSVFWLVPQHALIGLCEAFSIIGQIEFFNKEFPENLRTMANALVALSTTFATYVSTMVIIILHGTTGGHGRPDWLTDDLNAGRLDYYYLIVAAIAFVNLFIFVFCAMRYRYKTTADDTHTVKPHEDEDEELQLTSHTMKLDV